MKKFDFERVIAGANLIRSHYSLNDTVRNDHLIFINAILTTIGAEIGIVYTHIDPQTKTRSHWGNITYTDWHADETEFSKVYKFKSQINIDSKRRHKLTLYNYEWVTGQGYKVSPLDKEDRRITIVNGILEKLRDEGGLNENALERIQDSLLSNSQNKMEKTATAKDRTINTALAEEVDEIVRETLKEQYNAYAGSYLLTHPSPNDVIQNFRFPIFFAQQTHASKRRFNKDYGYGYGIKLHLFPEQVRFLSKKDQSEIDLSIIEDFQTQLGNERSILDSSFSLGVVRRSDITKDDDSYQWPNSYKPTKEELAIKTRRNTSTTTVFTEMTNYPDNGTQVITHPFHFFGCPFCLIGLVLPRRDKIFSNTDPSLWRHRHLFYSELVIARISRKFRASLTRKVLSLIKHRTQMFLREYRFDVKVVHRRLVTFFEDLNSLLPIPRIKLSLVTHKDVEATFDGKIDKITPQATLVHIQNDHFLALSLSPEKSSAFNKTLKTPFIDKRFVKSVGKTLSQAIINETQVFYNRFNESGLSVETEIACNLAGEFGTRYFKKNENQRLLLLVGKDKRGEVPIEPIAHVYASVIQKDALEPSLRCALGSEFSFWHTMAHLMPLQDLLELSDIDELALHKFKKEHYSFPYGEWAKKNPYGAVIALMHERTNPEQYVIRRLRILLDRFYTTRSGTLILTLQDEKIVQQLITGRVRKTTIDRLRITTKDHISVYYEPTS